MHVSFVTPHDRNTILGPISVTLCAKLSAHRLEEMLETTPSDQAIVDGSWIYSSGSPKTKAVAQIQNKRNQQQGGVMPHIGAAKPIRKFKIFCFELPVIVPSFSS